MRTKLDITDHHREMLRRVRMGPVSQGSRCENGWSERGIEDSPHYEAW